MKINCNTLVKNNFPHNYISRRNAYHQAGLAVSTYLGNRRKGLPPLHFQIALNPTVSKAGRLGHLSAKHRLFLQGGRLIPFLPATFEMAARQLTPYQIHQCQHAFEADVANLLAGSLAEAKYVAMRDDEVFNANLVYLGALKFYGGGQDMKLIEDYMTCLYPEGKDKRNKKLAELFLSAYGFINDSHHWRAISALATVLYAEPKDVVACEDIMAVVDESTWPTHNLQVTDNLAMNS